MRRLDALDSPGAVVGVRIDVHTGISESGDITCVSRHKAHAPTINELVEKNTRVILLAHHYLSDEEDGKTSTEIMQSHADILSEYIDTATVTPWNQTEEDDLKHSIHDLDDGDVLLLDNLADMDGCLQEYETQQEATETPLVEQLAPELDAYVNDAFSISNKMYPSIVGFPAVLPSYAGRVVESEKEVLSQLEGQSGPHVYVVGGNRVSEKLELMDSLLKEEQARKILTTGLISTVFLYAAGYNLGDNMKEELEARGVWESINKASELLTQYGEYIEYPNDVAVEDGGERTEFALSACPLPDVVKDIGQGTLEEYISELDDAEAVIACGTAGIAEESAFQTGTEQLLKNVSEQPYNVIAGMSTMEACDELGITGFKHSSTGSQAAFEYLSTESLPGFEVLLPSD